MLKTLHIHAQLIFQTQRIIKHKWLQELQKKDPLIVGLLLIQIKTLIKIVTNARLI